MSKPTIFSDGPNISLILRDNELANKVEGQTRHPVIVNEAEVATLWCYEEEWRLSYIHKHNCQIVKPDGCILPFNSNFASIPRGGMIQVTIVNNIPHLTICSKK